MSLLSPAALAALALLVPLVALYLRRRQTVSREVPSLMLWRAVQRDLAPQTGLRRFRRDRSLWLHAAALALTALALASPLARRRQSPARRLVLVVDTTASMQAREGSVARIDLARAAARRALATLSDDGEAVLLEAGCLPAVRVARTTDLRAVSRSLDALRARDCGGDLGRAMALAADGLRGARGRTRLVVITDAVTRADALGAALPVEVEQVRVGRPHANVGITAAELRVDAEHTAGARRYGLFVALHASPGRASGDVTLRVLGDAGEVAVRRMQVGGARVATTLPVDLAADDATRTLTLRLDVAVDDALAVDDVAWVPVPPSPRLPVRLVTDLPSPWVARALRADRDVALTELSPDGWARVRAAPFDGLTVFHGTAPETTVPGASLSWEREGRDVPARLGVSLGPWQPSPRWTDVSPTDPRARFVGVADVHLHAARPVTRVAGDVPLITTTSGVVGVARDTRDASATVLGFDPDRTDWPLRPGFVLFLRDAVEHARGRRDALALDARHTGRPVTIATTRDVVTVRGPGGSWELSPHEGVATWSGTDRAGVYTVQRGRGDETVALSLLDPVETSLAPQDLPWRGTVRRDDATRAWENRPVGWLFALLAALALAVEWALVTGWRARPPTARAFTGRP